MKLCTVLSAASEAGVRSFRVRADGVMISQDAVGAPLMTAEKPKALVAHSLAEAYLYLLATRCAACGSGPLRGSDATGTSDRHTGGGAVIIEVTCAACGRVEVETFALPHGIGGSNEQGVAIVNLTGKTSQLIDVGQWITLFRMIIEAAERERDKTTARRLALEAAQCLDEALRFYDDPTNDLPPPDAIFTKDTRTRYSRNPEQFSRRRLIDLRLKLPFPAYAGESTQAPPRRSWWRRLLGRD